MQNEPTRYLIPPKLQSKMLIAFWTVIELLTAVGLIALSAATATLKLLFLPVFLLVITGRFTGENSLAVNMLKRIRYAIRPRVYQMTNKY